MKYEAVKGLVIPKSEQTPTGFWTKYVSSAHSCSGPQKPPLLKKVARMPPDWRASRGEAPMVKAVARRADRVASVNCILKIGESTKTWLEGDEVRSC